jgi:hypothetical protein
MEIFDKKDTDRDTPRQAGEEKEETLFVGGLVLIIVLIFFPFFFFCLFLQAYTHT